MLHKSRGLHFPNLSFIKETSFGPWGNDGTTRVYKLDWKGFRMLPEPYDTWLRRFTFVLPNNYFEGITRCAQMANIEWGQYKPFDTAVRPYMAGVGHVYDAFVLMADCLYDQNKDYYYRGKDKHLIRYALMAKFWFNNTGRGMVEQFAMFHKIKSDALHNWIERDFLEMMDKFSMQFNEDICQAERDSGVPQSPDDPERVPEISSESFEDIWSETAQALCPKVPEGWAPNDGMPMVCSVGVTEHCQHGPCGCPDILGRQGAKGSRESWSPLIKDGKYEGSKQPSTEAPPETISAGVDPLAKDPKEALVLAQQKAIKNGICPVCGAEIAHRSATEECSAGCGWTRSGL